MDHQLFNDLQHTLKTQGPAAAIDLLCTTLQDRKDYASLFYALLMKKRHELGVSPMTTGPASDLPHEVHQVYEEAIRESCRRVGRLFLDEGNIAQAWSYFRMIDEPQPVALALEKVQPSEDEDIQQLVEIAYYQGVHPERGFDLILQRYGICSGITVMAGQEFPHGPKVRDYCIRRLVQALYDELRERLLADISRSEGFVPKGQGVAELLQGRDWLFGEDCYHIDMSHLSSVVQMAAVHLQSCAELNLARELCAYGLGMSPRFRIQANPPFDDFYRDYHIFLALLAGEQVAEGLAHFRAKVEEADPATAGTFPAEVLVNLLVRIGRLEEAVAVARQHLLEMDESRLSCPSAMDLCQRLGDYAAFAEVARHQKNPVQFLAGLLAASK